MIGIKKKVDGQINALRTLGYETDTVLDIDIKAVHNNYDIVYTRIESYRLISKYIHKNLIIEINSKLPFDDYVNIKHSKLRDVFYMFRHLNKSTSLTRVFYYLFKMKKIINNARLIIFNSEDIADYYIRKYNFKYKIIGNGIDFSKISLLPERIFEDNLNLLLLSGSKRDHGVDRLLYGIKKYSGNINVKLCIIGEIDNKTKSIIKTLSINNQVKLKKAIYGEELFNYIKSKSFHLGIGSLSFHRYKIYRTDVLKTKEYMAMGLPFVLSHEESVLERNKKFKNSYIKVPANDSYIDIKNLIVFVERFYKNKENSFILRENSLKSISWKEKMNEVFNFIE